MAFVTKVLRASAGNVWQLVMCKKVIILCLFLVYTNKKTVVLLSSWTSLGGIMAHNQLLQVHVHADQYL